MRKLICLLFALCSVLNAGGKDRNAAEQTSFGAEIQIKRPIEIPESVFALLAKDEDAVNCVKMIGALKPNWFRASEVVLNASGQQGLIVTAGDVACFHGANVDPFWIFERMGNDWKLLVKQEALQVDFLSIPKSGYRELKFSAAIGGGRFVGTFFYRYKNGRYRLVQRSTTKAQN